MRIGKRVLDRGRSFPEKTTVTVGDGCTPHARVMDRCQCMEGEACGLSLRAEAAQPDFAEPDTALTQLASVGMPRCRSPGPQ